MFAFRQFSVDDSKCAMKVGTDAVILGAYAEVASAGRILDIGTGCGVIALILAQRAPEASIEGIEIDYHSAHQAMENAARSPFSEKIKIYHTPLQEFIPTAPYHLIVSNPPFFERSLPSPDRSRHLARHQETLTNDELLSFATKHLADTGFFSVIIPHLREKDFLQKAASHSFFLRRHLEVYSKPDKKIRSVMEFSRGKSDAVVSDFITIRNNVGTRTEKYSALTKNFYSVP